MLDQINPIFNGDLRVEPGQNLTLSGMVKGNVDVTSHSKLTIKGVVHGNITIAPEAEVVIAGTVQGQINNSGTLLVSGVVGDCPNAIHGNVTFASGSFLNNQRMG